MMIGNRFRTFAIAFTAALTSRAAAIEPSQPTDLDPNAIELAAGTPATVMADGVVRSGEN